MALLVTDGVDWELDPTTWDVVIPLRRVAGAKGVGQRIKVKLKMIRGEWFSNLDAGMPWFSGNGVDAKTAILGQAFAEVRTRAEVRKIILSIPGVDKIRQLAVTFDRKSRILRIVWRVDTIWGDTVADELAVPLAA